MSGENERDEGGKKGEMGVGEKQKQSERESGHHS